MKMTKEVTPSLGLDSYSCPHCRAFAHQSWHRVFVSPFEKGKKPDLIDPEVQKKVRLEKIEDDTIRETVEAFTKRIEKNILTYRTGKYNYSCPAEMVNMSLARCYACDAFSVWVNGTLQYPASEISFVPSADMPSDVKSDFEEAAIIFQKSPRGAAALLRLAIERLMPHLDQKGKDLNEDIGKLVQNGLDPVVQKALDVVRVIGNNAVHPGQIDLNDDQDVAAKLFSLVNIIVTMMITTRKKIDEMFEGLPPSAKAAIERRDAPKESVQKRNPPPTEDA